MEVDTQVEIKLKLIRLMQNDALSFETRLKHPNPKPDPDREVILD